MFHGSSRSPDNHRRYSERADAHRHNATMLVDTTSAATADLVHAEVTRFFLKVSLLRRTSFLRALRATWPRPRLRLPIHALAAGCLSARIPLGARSSERPLTWLESRGAVLPNVNSVTLLEL